MPPPSRPPGRDGGFTLVELLVVIVLLGVLAAVAGPRFADTGPFTARGQADALLATVRAAQSTAVARRATVHVQARAADGTVTLCTDSACASPVPSPEGDAVWLRLDPAVRLAADAAWSIDGLGRPSFASALELALLYADGSATGHAVRIEPETGYAHRP